MFIVSKKNFQIRRPDGSSCRIRKDWAGELPEDVAGSWLVQAAIRSGSIIASPSTKDKDLVQAEAAAEQKAQAADIRPDAQNADIPSEVSESAPGDKADGKKASGSKK